jgi:hypothetical protein
MTAQTASLTNRITAVQLLGNRLTASVQLVAALGGDWNMEMIPTSKQMGEDIKWTDYLIIPVLDQGK